jgi:DNA repair protein RecO (recombination protein O)
VTRTEKSRANALLLERFPYGESSLVAHVLTAEHGRVHLLAKGCFRPGSAHYCTLDVFDTLSIEYAARPAGELCPLTSAVVLRRRASIAADLPRYRCAVTHLELIELGAREGHEESAAYALLEAALERLRAQESDPEIERIVFDLAFLQNLGLAPALEACAACGLAPAPRGEQAFSRGAGGVLCARCAAEARASGRAVETLARPVLSMARALARCAPAQIRSIRMQPNQTAAVRAFVEGFLFHHLEQAPRSRRARGAEFREHAPADGNASRQAPGRASRGMRTANWLLIASLCCAALASCGSSTRRSKELEAGEASARLETVKAATPTSSALQTFLDLADLWNTSNLPPETRLELDQLLDVGLAAVLPELTKADSDPDELEDLFELDLPRRLRARIAVARARLLLNQGERKDSWRQIRDLDALYRAHEERVAAGAIVAEAGLSLARDSGTYFGIFHYRDAATEVLEDLVLHYPADPHCAEAYAELAEIKAEQHEYGDAIERLEELVVYFPNTTLAETAALRIPELRIAQVGGPDKDRGGLVRAQAELAQWLERHPEHPLRERALAVQARASDLSIDSDLHIAAYYRRIGEPTGQRLHADRALALATSAGDEDRIAAARALVPVDAAAEKLPGSVGVVE